MRDNFDKAARRLEDAVRKHANAKLGDRFLEYNLAHFRLLERHESNIVNLNERLRKIEEENKLH